jgi:D-glycero-D-manno-heptose 1,7-bisphosphate phosphatase
MLTLLPNGCAMIDRAGPVPTESRPGLLLDRDGIVVVDTGYLGDPRAVRLVRGAAGLIAAANRAGWPVAVVTNQSVIGRGLYDWHAFAAV